MTNRPGLVTVPGRGGGAVLVVAEAVALSDAEARLERIQAGGVDLLHRAARADGLRKRQADGGVRLGRVQHRYVGCGNLTGRILPSSTRERYEVLGAAIFQLSGEDLRSRLSAQPSPSRHAPRLRSSGEASMRFLDVDLARPKATMAVRKRLALIAHDNCNGAHPSSRGVRLRHLLLGSARAAATRRGCEGAAAGRGGSQRADRVQSVHRRLPAVVSPCTASTNGC